MIKPQMNCKQSELIQVKYHDWSWKNVFVDYLWYANLEL